ncbi:MAG: hypothetical protein JXD18_07570 [Anaerolineae bacterium]|nr:hypothetical protein [Anaerolineae bacterium]
MERLDRIRRLLLIGLAVLAPVWLLTLVLSRLPAPAAPVPPVSPLTLPDACTLTVTHYLLDVGLPASATFDPDGTLYVDVPYTPARGAPPDVGAQAVWHTFDTASQLPPACAFRRLHVMVHSADLELHAQVAASHLRAWAAGSVDDDGLSDYVTYTQWISPSFY